MRRVGIVVTVVLATALVGFAGWCVALLREVSEAREGVEQRVGWLGDLQTVRSIVVDAARTGEMPDAELRLHALDLDLLARRQPSDPLATHIAATTMELRALRANPEDTARRASVAASVGQAETTLRRETSLLSSLLADNWRSLEIVALSAIAMATGLLFVAAYGLLVVGPRLRADARRLTALSRRLEDAMLAGRGLGHELGGPFTAALTTLQMLRDGLREGAGFGKEQMTLLEEAIAALSRASGTLQDLRAESDSHEEPTADVKVALDEAVAATAVARGRRATITIDAENVGLAALPQPIVRRVFTQILGDAVEAGTADDRIEVRTRQERTLIAVEFGVAAGAVRGQSFTSLSRALSVLGGSLSVRREGQGGVVRVELPPHATPAPAPAPAIATRPAATQTAARRLRILLIDDDEFVLSSVSRVLAQHDVVTQSDPDLAIEAAIGEHFDLVLCDMMMPRRTGIEVFRAVTGKRPELASSFVFMSGGSAEPEIAEFLDHAPGRIDKPFGADELRKLVARVAATPATAS
jgi:CheY-like chemotaxis protein